MSATGGAARWLCGTVGLRVRTAEPAAFLNALLGAGLAFTGARAVPGGLAVHLAVADFRRLRPVVRGLHVRLRLESRRGLPFLGASAWRRRIVLVTLALSAFVMYGLSGYVWFVQISGADRVTAGEVRGAVAALGLRPGIARAHVSGLRIARELPLRLPELSWAAVAVRGTFASVQVVERIRPAPAYEEAAVPGDLVAAEAGVVTAVSVRAGQALVRAGDRVHAGQVLIAGGTVVPVGRKRGSGVEGMARVAVHASGTVLVRKWYGAYAQAARSVQVEVPTGAAYTRVYLQVGPARLPLWGLRREPFAAYTLSRRVAGPPSWRSVPLPVELITLRYAEVTRFLRRLSVDDAAAIAAARAREQLLPGLPARARILEERQRAVLLPNGSVGVELLVQSEENIVVFRPAVAGGAAH